MLLLIELGLNFSHSAVSWVFFCLLVPRHAHNDFFSSIMPLSQKKLADQFETSFGFFFDLHQEKMKYFLLVTLTVAFQMPNGNDMMLIERLSNSMGARVNKYKHEKS